MAQCKKCGIIFEKTHNRQEYCLDCKLNLHRDDCFKYDNKTNKIIGNPKQDMEIIKFLRKKRKVQELRYGNKKG